MSDLDELERELEGLENGEAEGPTSHAPALLEADKSAAAEESEPGEAADEDDAGVNKSTTVAVLAAEPAEQAQDEEEQDAEEGEPEAAAPAAVPAPVEPKPAAQQPADAPKPAQNAEPTPTFKLPVMKKKLNLQVKRKAEDEGSSGKAAGTAEAGAVPDANPAPAAAADEPMEPAAQVPVKPTEGAAAPTVKAPAAKKKAISVKPLEAKPATEKESAGAAAGADTEPAKPKPPAVKKKATVAADTKAVAKEPAEGVADATAEPKPKIKAAPKKKPVTTEEGAAKAPTKPKAKPKAKESADADTAEPAVEQPPADAQAANAPGEAVAPVEGAKAEAKAPAVKKKVKKAEDGETKTEQKSKPRSKPKAKVVEAEGDGAVTAAEDAAAANDSPASPPKKKARAPRKKKEKEQAAPAKDGSEGEDADMEDGAPKPKPKKRGPSRKRARPPKSGAKGGEGEQDEEEAAAQAKAEESSEDDWGWDSDNEADYVLCSSADGKKLVVACKGKGLDSAGVIEARPARMQRTNGRDPSCPVTLAMLDEYERWEKRFKMEYHDRVDSRGQLDLDDLPEGSALETCFAIGKLRTGDHLLSKVPKGNTDFMIRVPALKLSMVTQRWLDQERLLRAKAEQRVAQLEGLLEANGIDFPRQQQDTLAAAVAVAVGDDE